MPIFKKKPVTIEAHQYKKYGELVKGMCNSKTCFSNVNKAPHVHPIHDNQMVNVEVGDWIIPEPDGQHFYPVKHRIFADTYDWVTV